MKSYAPRTETGKRKLKNMRIDVQKKGTYAEKPILESMT
jgi:hypothetical protein